VDHLVDSLKMTFDDINPNTVLRVHHDGEGWCIMAEEAGLEPSSSAATRRQRKTRNGPLASVRAAGDAS